MQISLLINTQVISVNKISRSIENFIFAVGEYLKKKNG